MGCVLMFILALSSRFMKLRLYGRKNEAAFHTCGTSSKTASNGRTTSHLGETAWLVVRALWQTNPPED